MDRDIIAVTTDREFMAVMGAQRRLRLTVTGEMDKATAAALRGLQRFWGLEVTGYLDKPTAALLDRTEPPTED